MTIDMNEVKEARREAVASMGYTECRPRRWLKPIGYQVFEYNEDLDQWRNWYLDGTGKISVYERQSFDDRSSFEECLKTLKEWEYGTKLDLIVRGESRFELSSDEVEGK